MVKGHLTLRPYTQRLGTSRGSLMLGLFSLGSFSLGLFSLELFPWHRVASWPESLAFNLLKSLSLNHWTQWVLGWAPEKDLATVTTTLNVLWATVGLGWFECKLLGVRSDRVLSGTRLATWLWQSRKSQLFTKSLTLQSFFSTNRKNFWKIFYFFMIAKFDRCV